MEKENHLGRRKFYRLKTPYLVCYRGRQDNGTFGHYDYTLTRDISCGGMLIITDRKFAKGTEIEIILRLPLYPDKKISARGVVASFEKDTQRKLVYKTRIKFVDFDEKVFLSFNEFVNKEMEKADKEGHRLSEKMDRRKNRKSNKPKWCYPE